MRDLPARPDLDQLRHQAKDLLRDARKGDPEAAARIRSVSDRTDLSSAQLALARDYGFASWTRLKLEVERRAILDDRDLSRLTRLLAEHPEMATGNLQRWADNACEEPLGYVTMLRFNRDRLGLPGELPGTGAVARALIEAGAPVGGRPGDRETPLITAASYGDAEVASVLIEAGADLEAVAAPDAGGVPGGTALLHAVVFGMTEVVDVLIAAGARVDSLETAAAAGDVAGWPLDRCTPQSRLRALVFAADHQRLDVIDRLVAAGTPVNEPDAEWGRLPLHTAAGHGRAAAVRRLLGHGADPDLRDPVHRRTALEECERPGRSPAHEEVAALLRPVTGRGGRRPARAEPTGIQIRIEARDLPGRSFGPSANAPEYRNVHVGVARRARRDEILDPHPGDAGAAAWTLEAIATPVQAGFDVKGPYIQGAPGERFIHLSWGAVDGTGAFTVFRRAKLMLDAVDSATLDAARRHGRLTARLALTGADGGPVCGAVRPPLIEWSADQAG
ncbi:DUF5990 family protein [Actinomadura chibensis]|uniref:Ankyrin repeat domain-containing protein n=1 Tax=Actinomadura chibensis TaxID=392828 RepID=A0A5D0NBV0_9ACTN|nr:DUF5990 family protein [Actinomadura chibensis]TYB41853.1 ankyrin repeat domain-containing protein [Actinomadura chibensis]